MPYLEFLRDASEKTLVIQGTYHPILVGSSPFWSWGLGSGAVQVPLHVLGEGAVEAIVHEQGDG